MHYPLSTCIKALMSLGFLGRGYAQGYDPREATIASTHHALFTGLTDCHTIVSSFISRIEALNNQTNAIIALDPTALDTASRFDSVLESRNGTTGPLFCIPVLLKDNYDTASVTTTGGCLDLADSQPSVDAPAVAVLKQAGVVILGKANLHELALEGISVSSLGGQTINPYDFTRTPGGNLVKSLTSRQAFETLLTLAAGSSGGSGAAVAASFSVFATGSDTVNSLRSPASANSLFSCRPTRGLISRGGIIPISYTQDVIGPIGRCVSDVATALTVMAGIGFDPQDNATALVPVGVRDTVYTEGLASKSLSGMRFGILEGFFNRTAGSETTPVNDAMSRIEATLRHAGAIIVPINETLYNATAILADLDTQRYEYRQEMDNYLRRPSLVGHHPNTLTDLYRNSSNYVVLPSQYEYVSTALVSSTDNITLGSRKSYDTVQAGILNLTLALQETFARNSLDAILYPEQKNLVVKIGSASQSGRNGILAALTGHPVVTVPAGFSPATATAPVGVPIGMEILGQPWTEAKLLQIAYQIEQITRIRKSPAWAKQVVPIKSYSDVPSITPSRENIPSAYPLGTL